MLQPQDKFFRGRPVSHFGGKLPIAFIHQDLGLIEWMTVAENLAFGLGFPRRGGLIQWKDVSRQADGLRARGIGMLYVSHRLDEIFRLTDRTAVMRDGRLVAVFPTRQTTPQELVTLIVGHKIAEIYPRAPQPDTSEPMLEARDLSLWVASWCLDCHRFVLAGHLRGIHDFHRRTVRDRV